MISIPDAAEVEDLNQKIDALCDHLKVRLVTVASTIGFRYECVPDTPPMPMQESKTQ